MQYPFNNSYALTSPFGWRVLENVREFHDGVDFGCPANTPILAATDGTITLATFSTLWGNYIELTESAEIMTKYAHLNAFNVSIGQQVKQGEIIGWSGSTGRSTGAHLHFGVAERGVFVDPLIHLNNNSMSFDKNSLYISIDNNANFDEPTKVGLKNAIKNDDWLYVLTYSGSEPRRFLAEANVAKYKAETALKDLSSITETRIRGLNDVISAGNKITQEYANKIVELSKEIDTLNAQIEELKKGQSVVPTTPEKWDWNKFFIGLSKNATIQSVIGVAITSGISWICSQIPELQPLQTEITVGLLGLLGVGVVGQNTSNVVKANQ